MQSKELVLDKCRESLKSSFRGLRHFKIFIAFPVFLGSVLDHFMSIDNYWAQLIGRPYLIIFSLSV